MLAQSKTIKITLFLCLFFFALACNKKPNVCISANHTKVEVRPDSGVVNVPREFVVNCDRDASSYEWDFGDETSVQTGRIVSHTFTLPGTYTITCTGFTKKNSASVTLSYTVVPQ
jgi:hypothetical protein